MMSNETFIVLKTVSNTVTKVASSKAASDASPEGQDRSTCKSKRASSDKKSPKESNAQCILSPNNEICSSPKHISFQEGEKKSFDTYQVKPTPSDKTDIGCESADGRCVGENDNGGVGLCREPRIHPMKVNSPNAECEPDAYINKDKRISAPDQNKVATGSGRLTYFTRVNKIGLRETVSESVLGLARRESRVVLSPSNRSFRRVTKLPVRIKKSASRKMTMTVSKSPSLEGVKNMIDTPKIIGVSDEKVKSIQESGKYLQQNITPADIYSYSSKMSEVTRTSSHYSNYSSNPPYQSPRNKTSMDTHFLQRKKYPYNVRCMESPKRSAFLQQFSPEKSVKNQQNKKGSSISVTFSPQLIQSSATNVSSSLPIVEKLKGVSGFPHKCNGCENLHKDVKKFKCQHQTEKVTSLSHLCTQESKKIVANKPQHVREQQVQPAIVRKCYTKNTGKSCKVNGNRMLAICDRAEKKISAAKKLSPFERKKDMLTARSNMLAVKNVTTFLAYPMPDVSRDKTIVPTHKKRMIKRTQRVKERAKVELTSSTVYNKTFKDNKITSNVQYFNYKRKVPFSRKGSSNSKFKQSLMESSIAQTYTAFSRNASINPRQSTKRSEHFSPLRPGALMKKSLERCRMRIKVSPPKSKLQTMADYVSRTWKDKRKKKTTKKRAPTKRGMKGYPPGACTKSGNEYPLIPFSQYTNQIQSESNVPITDVKIAHCEINKDISNYTNTDSNEQDDLKQGGTCWGRYKNTKESISSFYTQFSAWSKNCKEQFPNLSTSQRGRVGFLRGPIALPTEKTPGIKHKSQSFKKCAHTNHAIKSVCAPPTTSNQSDLANRQNQCCEATLIPSFFSFLKSMNKAIAEPMTFNQGSVNVSELPKIHQKIIELPPKKQQKKIEEPPKIQKKAPVDSMSSRGQLVPKCGSSTSEKSVTLVDNNFTEAFSVLTTLSDSDRNTYSDDLKALKESMLAAEVKKTNTYSDDLKALKESVLAGDMKKTNEINSQLVSNIKDSQNSEKLCPENDKTCVSEAKEAELVASEVKIEKKKNTSFHSYAPKSAARSILRKGRILSTRVTVVQLGRREIINLGSKIKNCPRNEINCDYTWEESSHSSHCSSSISESKTDHRVLTFGLIVVTIIVQAILYFSVPIN